MALARPVDAVGPEQPGVEPLRRIGRRHLHGEHEAQFVEEGARVAFGIEVAALPAPIGPGAGQAVEHLLGRGLADGAGLLVKKRKRLRVGGRAPQPRRDGLFLDLLQAHRDAGLAEVFLRQDVGGDLRPEFRHLDIVRPEYGRAVRVADLARGEAERDVRVSRLSFFGVAPLDPHLVTPFCRFLPHRPAFMRRTARTLLPATRTGP
jgi:hypothetical protein